jgi:hypothetical protein
VLVFRICVGRRSARSIEKCGAMQLCAELGSRANILLARKRSSERMAMALMSSTATARVSEMMRKTHTVESHCRIAPRARKTACRKK